MDAFVTIKTQKNQDVLGRTTLVKTIMEYVNSGETLCVYGDIGVGKSHLVHSLIKGVELSHGTNLDLLSHSSSHVIVDNIETEGTLWKEISTRKKLSRGCTIIITCSVKNVDFCDCVEIEPLSQTHQLELVSLKYPSLSNKEFINECMTRAKGNLRNLFHFLENSDDKDIFLSPKDFIHMFLTEKGRVSIGDNVDDHGYSWGIVHENYIDAKDIDYANVINDISLADVYDTKIYEGSWGCLPFFCHHGIIKPALEINGTLNKECLRPGSAWTKFNNFKMRQNRLTDIKNRSMERLDVEALLLIRDYCIKDPDRAVEMMVTYGMKSQDVDIINHLAIKTKIKPMAVQSIKKKLKHALGED